VWSPSLFDARRAGRVFLAPRGLAGIGNGLPATIGAKLAAPERQVVGYGGDGAFILSLHELATMKEIGIKAVYVVSNNQCYAYGRKIYENLNMPVISHDLGEFNYADIARAFGCFGVRVEQAEEIRGALEAARDSGLPAVVEVVTDIEFPTRAAGFVVKKQGG
jgi:acetolactate synthase-1/2/3 large subunit